MYFLKFYFYSLYLTYEKRYQEINIKVENHIHTYTARKKVRLHGGFVKCMYHIHLHTHLHSTYL